MEQHAAATPQGDEQHSKLRGRPWPKGVSGNPSGSRTSKRAVLLADEMAADLGELNAIERTMLAQACKLLIRSERVKDLSVATRMSSEARRLLELLRRHAAPKPAPAVRLADRWAAEFASENENEAESEDATGAEAVDAPADAEAEIAADDDDESGEPLRRADVPSTEDGA